MNKNSYIEVCASDFLAVAPKDLIKFFRSRMCDECFFEIMSDRNYFVRIASAPDGVGTRFEFGYHGDDWEIE